MSGNIIATGLFLENDRLQTEAMQKAEAHRDAMNKKNKENQDLKNNLNQAETLRQHAEISRNEQARQLRGKIEELQEYDELLARPLHEIAAKHGAFRERWEEQQALLAGWIVSQRAFKDLAMKYGSQAGKTPEEIQNELDEATQKVLNNNADFSQNNVDKTDLTDSLVNKLKNSQNN